MWCFVRNCLRFRILGALGLVLCLLLTGCRAERARRTLSDAALSPVAPPTSVLQPVPTYTPTPVPLAAEREALAALYEATGGSSWAVDRQLHWRSEVPLAHWTGVTLNAQGQVKGLELAGVGLRGQVPAALGHLTALETLDLTANLLYGPLPRELGQLSLLQKLYLEGNAWTGCLPAAWRGLDVKQSDVGQLSLPFCDTETRGTYGDAALNWSGTYQLQRRDTEVTATLRTPRAPRPLEEKDSPVLFRLPPGYLPEEPYTRRVWGHRVQADGQRGPEGLVPQRARIWVSPEGAVRLVPESREAGAGYWAYTVTVSWDTAQVKPSPPGLKAAQVPQTLSTAAQAGRAGLVRELLAAGAELEAKDAQGRTPLLLAAGATVEGADGHDQTPLHRGMDAGNPEVVRQLLAAGADPEHALLFFGRSLQGGALAYAHIPIADELLAAGANPHVEHQDLHPDAQYSSHSEGPLHEAATMAQAVMVDLLLGAGANPHALSSEGATPLHALCNSRGCLLGSNYGRHAESSQALVALERLLAAGANPNATVPAEADRTPLHLAVALGWVSGVERLLAAGADPFQADAERVTPVQLAEQMGQAALAEMLRGAGGHPEIPLDYGWTPLHRAAQQQAGVQVAELLAQGSNPNVMTYYGETSLHQAAQGQDVNIVARLLQAGAAIDVQTLDGYTPLHGAARLGSPAVVERLLAAGADRHLRSARGETPYQLAVRRERTAVAALLKTADPELPSTHP